MWIVFTVTVVIAIGGHLFVYFYQQSTKVQRLHYEETHKLGVSQTTIRRHTLLLRNVNNELPVDEVFRGLKELFP